MLRNVPRNQWVLVLAQCVESLGTFGVLTAVTLWCATNGASSSRDVTAAVVTAGLARVVVAPGVAKAVHRWEPSVVMMTANLVRAMGAGALALALGMGHGPLVIVLGGVFVVAALDAFFTPARVTLTQRNVLPDQRVTVGSLSFFAVSGIGMLSGAVSPIVLTAGGLTLVWACAGLLFLVSALGLRLGYRTDRQMEPTTHEVTGHVTSSFARRAAGYFSARHPARLVSWSAGGFAVGMGMTSQVLPLFALHALRMPASRYGALTVPFAVGGLVSAPFAPALGRRRSPIVVMACCAPLAAGGYVVFASLDDWVAGGVVMFVVGALFGIYSSVQSAVVQERVRNAEMPSYMSVMGAVAVVCGVVGNVVSGVVQHLAPMWGSGGYRETYVLASVIIAASGLVRAWGARGSVT